LRNLAKLNNMKQEITRPKKRPGEILTLGEAARTIGVHQLTLRRGIAAGELPAVVVFGRTLLEWSDLLNFIRRHARPAFTRPKRKGNNE
jgi:excisionase family DNA binding protein